MSEPKFTPGPWHDNWDESQVLFPFVWQKGGYAVAKMCGKPKNPNWVVASERDLADPEQVKSNAALIAAAPEMYEALGKCESCIRHLLYGVVDDPVAAESENVLDEIVKILKKARGEK